MASREFLFLVLLTTSRNFTMSHSIDKIRDSCPINARVNLTGEIPDVFETVKKFGYIFPPESTWRKDGETFGCFCFDKPCLPLCCPLEMVRIKGVCVTDNKTISATFPSIYSANMTADGVEVSAQNFHIVVSDPCTMGGYTLMPETESKDVYWLMNNGSIYLPYRIPTKTHKMDNYCLYRDNGSTSYRPRVCLHEQRASSEEKDRKEAKTTGHLEMIVSIPFLLATFIIYTILPEMSNVHGLTLRGYVGCLSVGYASMAVIQNVVTLSDFPCILAAYVSLFSFLASFFWLNVMCFDIWWTFGRSGLSQRRVQHSETRKCLFYSVYAWGCAVLLTGFCGVMDHLPGIPDGIFRPKFAIDKWCWFKDHKALALYFYGPMGATIICNIFFFVSTAVKLNRDANNAAVYLEGTDSERQHEHKWSRFSLYLKLFIVMGINWSMEIISWLGRDLGYEVWYVTDVGNALHGLIIFVIFICKKNVMILIMKRFGCKVPYFLSSNSTRYTRRNFNRDTTTATFND